MKVLLVFEKPGAFGYVGEEYMRFFYENKWHVTVCYLTGSLEQQASSQLPAHDAIFFDLTKDQIRGLKIPSIRRMIGLMKQRRFDLVISHQYQANSSVAVSGLFVDLPTAYGVFHGINPLSAFSRRLFYSTFGKKFNRLIAVSNTQCRNIAGKLFGKNRSKVVILRNTIDVAKMNSSLLGRRAARDWLSIQSEDFCIGTICRLTKDKRPMDLVYALHEIKTRFPQMPVKVVIIGEGKLKSTILQEANKLGISESVVVPGYVKNAWRLLKAMDLFVFPSRKESCGLVLLEAMTAKVPIIASDYDGIVETLGENGIYFEIGNYSALSNQILEYLRLSTDEKNRLKEINYSRVCDVFDKKNFQSRLQKLVRMDTQE